MEWMGGWRLVERLTQRSSTMKVRQLVAGSLALAIMCCSQQTEIRSEIVMTKGMRIAAVTPVGRIAIVAGEGYRRTYVWDHCEGSVDLMPRKQRWHGSLGIYYPGSGYTWWLGCGGITRAVVEEGQQHFASTEDVMSWLRADRGIRYVYRNDGLVVGWDLVPQRGQISVEVWQVLIGGQKPKSLNGAEDDKVDEASVRSS